MIAAPSPDAIDRLIADLDAAPTRLRVRLERLGRAALAERPGPDEWSAIEIVAHLRASDDLLVSRIFHALVVDDAQFGEVSERRWADVAGYRDMPLDLLLQTLTSRREELVRTLCGLAPTDWERAGQHAVRGRQTVFSIATHLAEHELEHLEQLEQLAAMATARE
jgi:hypothetical protein